MKILPQVAVFGFRTLFHRYRYRNQDRNRVPAHGTVTGLTLHDISFALMQPISKLI
jgi:hypothetical protein